MEEPITMCRNTSLLSLIQNCYSVTLKHPLTVKEKCNLELRRKHGITKMFEI